MTKEELIKLSKEWLNTLGETEYIEEQIYNEEKTGVYLEGKFETEYIETYPQTYDSPAEGYVNCSFDGIIVEFELESGKDLQEVSFCETWRVD